MSKGNRGREKLLLIEFTRVNLTTKECLLPKTLPLGVLLPKRQMIFDLEKAENCLEYAYLLENTRPNI